jgi:hypothetical protein
VELKLEMNIHVIKLRDVQFLMKAVDYMYQKFIHNVQYFKVYNLFSCEEISGINNLCKFIKIIKKNTK